VTVVQVTGVAVPASTSDGKGVGTPPVSLPPSTPAEAVPVPPVATPVEPEHIPEVVGWQVKLSPQSVSALQGSSYLYMHFEIVVSVQLTGAGSGTTPASQAVVVGSHFTDTGVPPVQLVVVWLLHTMVGPQSALVTQVAAWQLLVATGGGSSTGLQTPPSPS
jgi:hypothetical protein